MRSLPSQPLLVLRTGECFDVGSVWWDSGAGIMVACCEELLFCNELLLTALPVGGLASVMFGNLVAEVIDSRNFAGVKRLDDAWIL